MHELLISTSTFGEARKGCENESSCLNGVRVDRLTILRYKDEAAFAVDMSELMSPLLDLRRSDGTAERLRVP